jgi:hypothetical protein
LSVTPSLEPARERINVTTESSVSSITTTSRPSKASLTLSKANLATLDSAIQTLNKTEPRNSAKETRRRAFTALPASAPLGFTLPKPPATVGRISEDECQDQPTRLLNLNKKTLSPRAIQQTFGSAEGSNDFHSPSAAVSIIGSDYSGSGNDSNSSMILARRLSMVGKPEEENTHASFMDGETAKLKLENFKMEDIIAWHEIHKPPKTIRSVKFAFRKGTCSSVLDTATMFQDVHKALLSLPEYQTKNFQFKRHPDYYNFSCTYSDEGVLEPLKFDVEICKVWLLDLHAGILYSNL